MNADQLITEIGKSVAEAKSAQEYCLFWSDYWWMCMNKSEWAAWIQALGVFSAFIIAWWVNKKNRENELLRRVIEKSEAEKNRLIFLQEDISTFAAYLEYMKIQPGHVPLSKNYIQFLSASDDYRVSEQPGLYFINGVQGWKHLKSRVVDYYFLNNNAPNVFFVNKTVEAGDLFLKDFYENISKRVAYLNSVINRAITNKKPPPVFLDPEQKSFDSYLDFRPANVGGK